MDDVKEANNENNFTSDDVKTDKDIAKNDKDITSENVKNGIDKRLNNLKPITTLSKEEAAKRGRNGGIKSGETRRARKTAQELLKSILSKQMNDEQIEEILGTSSVLLGGDKSAYNVMMVKALQGAMSGDVKSQVFIRDTVGDAPVVKSEQKIEVSEQEKAIFDNISKRLLG